MGYDICITKSASIFDSEEQPITWSEWMSVVDADSTLRLSSTDWCGRQRNDENIERIYFVVWLAHPDTPPFLLMDGVVQIKNPDKSTIEKMVGIAHHLSARVLGEEDEEYLMVDGVLHTRNFDETVIEAKVSQIQ